MVDTLQAGPAPHAFKTYSPRKRAAIFPCGSPLSPSSWPGGQISCSVTVQATACTQYPRLKAIKRSEHNQDTPVCWRPMWLRARSMPIGIQLTCRLRKQHRHHSPHHQNRCTIVHEDFYKGVHSILLRVEGGACRPAGGGLLQATCSPASWGRERSPDREPAREAQTYLELFTHAIDYDLLTRHRPSRACTRGCCVGRLADAWEATNAQCGPGARLPIPMYGVWLCHAS